MNNPANGLRWVRRDGALVLQQRHKVETRVRQHRHYVSAPYATETNYEWRDVPVVEEGA